MKKSQLILVYKILDMNHNTDSIRFNYAINKNLKLIKGEIDSFKEIEKETEEVLSEYNEKKMMLFQKFGSPSEDGSQLFIKQDSDEYIEFQKEIAILENEYKEQIELHLQKTKDYYKFLEEDVEEKINFFKIKEEFLPKQNLKNLEDIDSLGILIEFDILE